MLTPKYDSQSEVKTVYNFQDIVDGTGIAVFYGALENPSAGTNYSLITNVLPSGGQDISLYISGVGTFNFDTGEFNTPRVCNGSAYLSCEFQAGSGVDYQLSVKLQKISNATTTDISSTISTAVITGSVNENVLLKIPLTKTSFNIGDKIRTIITIAGVKTGTRYLYIDPVGSAENPFKLNIPFLIQN
jgi:hypothetical protein